MKKDITRQVLVVITLLFMLTANGLAVALPLNGQTTGAISESFKVIFVPAGYVFSIWGLIYLFLIGFTVYQALPSQRENPLLQKVGFLVALSNMLNGVWILFWQYNHYVWTMVIMLGLLATLIAIFLRLEIGKRKFSTVEKWLVSIPFSVYLGWITVATIANATALLKYLGWSGWGIDAQIWTIILLGAGVIISAMMSFNRKDIAYALVLVWAFTGIAVKWLGVYPAVVVSAFVAVGFVLLFLVIARLRKPALSIG
jgi:benzodiazapine receptor